MDARFQTQSKINHSLVKYQFIKIYRHELYKLNQCVYNDFHLFYIQHIQYMIGLLKILQTLTVVKQTELQSYTCCLVWSGILDQSCVILQLLNSISNDEGLDYSVTSEYTKCFMTAAQSPAITIPACFTRHLKCCYTVCETIPVCNLEVTYGLVI